MNDTPAIGDVMPVLIDGLPHADLRRESAEDLSADAVMSTDALYRYQLSRCWDLTGTLPILVFLMLNPSTANEVVPDATTRRCITFARAAGYGGLVLVNLYALRSRRPQVLQTHADPIGAMNDEHIRAVVRRYRQVVCAWGAVGHRSRLARMREVVALVQGAGGNLLCLDTTQDGHPRHPLYLASSCVLRPWVPPASLAVA